MRQLKQLKEQYGLKSGPAAVNAAIRAELPGGSEVIDALSRADQIAILHGNKETLPILDILRRAKLDMADAVMEKGRWSKGGENGKA